MKKLAIITTHPIQYYAPIFKLLHQRKNITIKVFYTKGKENEYLPDTGFGKTIVWDIPLLEGYPYEWVKNTAANPGSHNFKGIVNPDLIGLINEWQPDALLVYGWAYSSHLKVLRYFKNKIPIYFRGDSTLLNKTGGIRETLKYIYLNWIYKHVNNAFYVGTNNKSYFKKYGLKETQLIFAPHAIDNERFKKTHKQKAADFRESLGIPDGAILILYAGKFEHVKNVELLLSAFIQLHKADVHLLLVGNGIKENILREKANNSSLTGNIHFSDFKNQSFMPVLYQAANLFCLPSLSETWGLAVNEAMACSTAVLVSDKVGCAVDLVENNYNGLVFKSESVDELIHSLQILTQSKELLHDFGVNSAEIIKDWNFIKIAEAIENKLMNEAN